MARKMPRQVKQYSRTPTLQGERERGNQVRILPPTGQPMGHGTSQKGTTPPTEHLTDWQGNECAQNRQHTDTHIYEPA